MSARSNNSGNLAAKKRIKREARIRENYDRISAALLNTDSSKFAARHPTRHIPDVPGIFGLEKDEIKKDTKSIEKNPKFLHLDEFQDEEKWNALVPRTNHPPVSEESTIMKKQRRLASWVNNPDLKDKDLEFWRVKYINSRSKFDSVAKEEENWKLTFETARQVTMKTIRESQESNRIMKGQVKLMTKLCEEESLKSGSTNSKLQWKDVIEEFVKREDELQAYYQELETRNPDSVIILADPITIPEDQTFTSGQSTEEQPMDDEEEARQVYSIYSTVREQVTRSEQLEFDIDMFFQDKDQDLNFLETILSEIFKSDKNQNNTDDSNGKSAADLEKDQLKKYYLSIIKENPEKLFDYINRALQSMEPSGTMTRKKRKANEVIPMKSFVRHRMQRGFPVLVSPLSCFEDRYLGIVPIDTVFGKAEIDPETKEKYYKIHKFVPESVTKAENEVIKRCLLQSFAAYTEGKIKILQQNIQDLQRLLQEGQNSLLRSESNYRNVLHEDLEERKRMRFLLLGNNLVLPNEDENIEEATTFVSEINNQFQIPAMGPPAHLAGGVKAKAKKGFALAHSLAAAVNITSSVNEWNEEPAEEGVIDIVEGKTTSSSESIIESHDADLPTKKNNLEDETKSTNSNKRRLSGSNASVASETSSKRRR